MRATHPPVPPLHPEADRLGDPLAPLLLAARQIAATVSYGLHGRRRVGRGETFWQFRRHQPGEAVGAVDWRQSARGDHLFVRETEWEGAQTAHLWADGAASMDYASRPSIAAKNHRAALLMMALAVLLVRGGERVARLSQRSTNAAPGTGRAILTQLAQAWERQLAQGPEPANPPHTAQVARDSQVILASDFLTPLDQTEATIRHFAGQGARGILLVISDPAEETFPFKGRVHFESPSGNEAHLIERSETVKTEYQAQWAAHHDALTAIGRHHGWPVIRHRTDRPATGALLALYSHLAAQAGRGP